MLRKDNECPSPLKRVVFSGFWKASNAHIQHTSGVIAYMWSNKTAHKYFFTASLAQRSFRFYVNFEFMYCIRMAWAPFKWTNYSFVACLQMRMVKSERKDRERVIKKHQIQHQSAALPLRFSRQKCVFQVSWLSCVLRHRAVTLTNNKMANCPMSNVHVQDLSTNLNRHEKNRSHEIREIWNWNFGVNLIRCHERLESQESDRGQCCEFASKVCILMTEANRRPHKTKPNWWPQQRHEFKLSTRRLYLKAYNRFHKYIMIN